MSRPTVILRRPRKQRLATRVFNESGGGLFLIFPLGGQAVIRHGDEELRVTVCGESGGGKYKLGFQGPKSFDIGREDDGKL